MAARIRNPFLVHSVSPRLSDPEGRRLIGLRRLDKRIVWETEGGLFPVFQLMVTDRFRWRDRAPHSGRSKVPWRIGLAAFDFPGGTLLLTEAGGREATRERLGLVRRGP